MKIAIKVISFSIVLFFLSFQLAEGFSTESVKFKFEKNGKTNTATGKQVINNKAPYPEFQAGNVDSSNAMGYVGDSKNFTVSARPYTVFRCDQVVIAPVMRITNFDDYCQKEAAFITMSIYMVNLLKTKDANSLFSSVLYGNAANKPGLLPGAPGCVDFRSRGGARVAVCLSNNDEANEILAAYDSFKQCQSGPLMVAGSAAQNTTCNLPASQNLTSIMTGVNMNYYSLSTVPGSAL